MYTRFQELSIDTWLTDTTLTTCSRRLRYDLRLFKHGHEPARLPNLLYPLDALRGVGDEA